jgi:hypothetical protein
MNFSLPQLNTNEELDVVAKNDEHLSTMMADTGFVRQMAERNTQANEVLNLTQASDNAATDGEVLVPNTNVAFVNSIYRPLLALTYVLIILCDFVIFPVLWTLVQVQTGTALSLYQPLSLMGAGLLHISMGTILGLATYGRTKEKIAGVA